MRITGLKVVYCVIGMQDLGIPLLIMATCNINSTDTLGLASYNMHGFNCDRSYLSELCDNPSLSIIAIQEHWLTPNNIQLINNIHPIQHVIWIICYIRGPPLPL